jgi:hypothetical protein
MRAVISMVILVLVSGCSSVFGEKEIGRVMLVDGRGTPVQGALVIPEYENPQNAPQDYSKKELEDRTSNAQGMVVVGLDEYYWDTDHCYHFRVRRYGFEDVTMSVSKDLFPAVLKIELDALPRAPRKSPDSKPAPVATPAGR